MVQNLDHLGIVAGLVDELGIVEQINQSIGRDAREQVSAGVVVKAMILNGLGFVSAPLYLFEQFFVGKATEHLLGKGVLPEHLNDDRLGRVLDALYLAGLSETFMAISLNAAKQFGVKQTVAHLDSTSFHVHGAYNCNSNVEVTVEQTDAEGNIQTQRIDPVPIEITYGYSRDHRPDLKQFVMNLICLGDGDIPAFIELADGNQVDKARFVPVMQAFRAQWTFDGLHVADAALYSEDNLIAMRGLKWLCRVPLTLKQAAQLVNELAKTEFCDTALAGYQIAECQREYGGVLQRWFVVESQERKQADLRKLEKTLATATQQVQGRWRQLCTQAFACEADARAAATRFQQQLVFHQLNDIQVSEQRHFDRPGKPAKDAQPTRFSYHLQANLQLNLQVVATHQQRAGRFILATNVLEPVQLSAVDALSEYKAQQGSERGFRFLKDPLFFASSVFLKTPARIAALGMVMGLCLLVYNLGQRQLRQALASAQQTIPNQLGKPTQRPTLRWVFQCFMAVHMVILMGVKQVVNLTDERQRVLQFLGSACRQYYLLC